MRHAKDGKKPEGSKNTGFAALPWPLVVIVPLVEQRLVPVYPVLHELLVALVGLGAPLDNDHAHVITDEHDPRQAVLLGADVHLVLVSHPAHQGRMISLVSRYR
jgi:hypothetical protein